MAQAGCDGVAPASIEIALLIPSAVSPLPTLDTTRLLVLAAFDIATGVKPMPSWHGGFVGG